MHYIKTAISAIANAANEDVRELISEESVEIKSNFSATFSNEGYSRYPRATLIYSRGENDTLEYFLVIGKYRFLLSPAMEIEPKPFSLIHSSLPDNELHIINHENGRFCYFRFSSSISKENFQVSMGACLADLISLYSLQLSSSGRLSSAKMISCLEKCHLLSAEERPLMQRIQEVIGIRQRISKIILQLKRHPSTVSRLEIQSLLFSTQNDVAWKDEVDVLFLKRVVEQSRSLEDIEILCKSIVYDETEELLGEDTLWRENLTTNSTTFTVEPVVAEPAPHSSFIEENLNSHFQGEILSHFSSPLSLERHQSGGIDEVAGDPTNVHSPVLAAVTWSEQPPITPAKAIPSHAETNALEEYTPETTMLLASLSTFETSVSVQLVSAATDDYLHTVREVVASPMVEVRTTPNMLVQQNQRNDEAVRDIVAESTTTKEEGKKNKKKNKKKKPVTLNGIDLEQLKQPIINAKATTVETFEETFCSSTSNMIQLHTDREETAQQLEELLSFIIEKEKELLNDGHSCDENARKSMDNDNNVADIVHSAIEKEQNRLENKEIINEIQEETVAVLTTDSTVVDVECGNQGISTVETENYTNMPDEALSKSDEKGCTQYHSHVMETNEDTNITVSETSHKTLQLKRLQEKENQVTEKQIIKRVNRRTNIIWTNIKQWGFATVMLMLIVLSCSVFNFHVYIAPDIMLNITSLEAERPNLLNKNFVVTSTDISDLYYQSPVAMELTNTTVSVVVESQNALPNNSFLSLALVNSSIETFSQEIEAKNDVVSFESMESIYISTDEDMSPKEITDLNNKSNFLLATRNLLKSLRQKFKSIINFPQQWLNNFFVRTGSLFKRIIK